ncbi:MAG: B12-binding domain-containing radical SAM protein [Omnitrophica WOR_2 bacterium]
MNIVLIAFQDQPNLGIGYIAGVLEREGFAVEVLDFRSGNQPILERVQQLDPLIIGLSIIFQYYTPEYAELVAFLRDHGVNCLICAGGHYPSLEYEATLQAMPGLDCIVRFEGEYTLLEIAHRLYQGKDWRDVQSIAYTYQDEIVATPLRSLIAHLDDLPFPKRWAYTYQCLGVQATSLLASRGCPRACTFCSIRRFYSIPKGGPRRTRSPENVIAEMLQLYNEHGVRIFLFQDDDFSLMSKRDREWTWQFLECLSRSEMAGHILWKISCRSDEVEAEIFSALRDGGLYMVYLGIESGNEVGLKTLNKHITVEQNFKAVATLKSLGLRYDFGFMLFDPSSTVDRVLENARFLKEICGDGSATASFGKTLPYSGTDLEKQMRQEGRLRGDVRYPDYSFLDPQTETWFNYLCEVFYPWVFGEHSLQAQLRWALFEQDVVDRFYQQVPGIQAHKDRLTFLTHWYNEIYCRIVEESAGYFRSDYVEDTRGLMSIRSAAEQQREWIEKELALERQAFFTEARFPLELVVGSVEDMLE